MFKQTGKGVRNLLNRKRTRSTTNEGKGPGNSHAQSVTASVLVQNNRLIISLNHGDVRNLGFRPEYIVLRKKHKSVWRRRLTDETLATGIVDLGVRSIFTTKGIEADDILNVTLESKNTGSQSQNQALVTVDASFGSDDVTNRVLGMAIYRPRPDDNDHLEVLGMSTYHLRCNIQEADDVAVLVPFANDSGGLSLVVSFRHQYLKTIKWASLRTIKSIKSAKDQRNVCIRAVMRDGNFIVEDVVLRLRNELSPVEIALPYTLSHEKEELSFEIAFNPSELPFREVYWDCFIVVRHYGSRCLIPIRMDKRWQARLAVGNQQWKLDDGKILFTHIAKKGALAFVYRNYYPDHDTLKTRAKEFAACSLYAVAMPYWKHKRIWLVYEKFCELAQDNGYYFFDYCMSLPETERKHIYYVIDKSQPDYANVECHDEQVLDFMSLKHILYTLAANMYVGSDSKSHLYIWRPKPSIIRVAMGKRKIAFLQHGVTALKRDANLFGKKGTSPMTYYITTSQNEQDIITSNFGYDPDHAPVLGFPRWDALENRADLRKPTILLMPTWRPWLEDVGEDLFEKSEYFKTFASLIQSVELIGVLEKHNAQLKFFIHPKFSDKLARFHTSTDRIELVEQGSEQLNDILMDSAMLITDYSSVCWDMLYMDKPVVFYQFDRDLYKRTPGSYIDLDKDLPGKMCLTEDELVSEIENCASNGFALDSAFAEDAAGWFAFHDRNNARRVYEFLIQQDC